MTLRDLRNMISHKLGLDKAIAFSSGARVIQAGAGAITVLFIASFLTGVEQGFYYTFGSVLALQVFFELGFTSVITQYVAHEAVYRDDPVHESRLAYLVRFCVKWYSVVAVAFFVIINLIGYFYFRRYDPTGGEVSWRLPWILLSAGSAINLFIAPFNSILQGMGKVKEMSRVSFVQQIFIPISLWGTLACGFKLYASGVSSLTGALVWLMMVFSTDLGKTLIGVLRRKITEKIDYLKEIFPYQWRIAVSWISGYFIFQLFNPVLFATEGAVVAGQMGMTLAVLNAIQAFSLSWQNTKIPYYSGLIELKRYKELDLIFGNTLKQMTAVCASLLVGMFVVIALIRHLGISINGNLLGDRFLDTVPMILMMIPLFANQFIGSWAAYLRCHNREPMLVQSVVMGILCCLSIKFCGEAFGLMGITTGYCCLTVFLALPWAYYIFVTKKKEWHGTDPVDLHTDL